MGGAGWHDESSASPATPPAPPVPPAYPPPLPSPEPLVDVKVVRLRIKLVLVVAALVVAGVWTFSFIHKANHSLARRSSGETPHVTEAPGVADLRFDLGNLAADMEPIAADGSKGNFDALPAECRKLSGDVQTAKGDMSAEIASDVRTDVNAMLTLLGQGVQSCAAGDNEAAAQSFNQALAEMTQATIELNR